MRRTAQLVSFGALAATLLPSVLFMAGSVDLATVKPWMLVASLVWFAATPIWMERGSP